MRIEVSKAHPDDRVWVAKIDGVQWFKPVPTIEDPKPGEVLTFSRSFGNGCLSSPAGGDKVEITIFEDGVFEVRSGVREASFYAVTERGDKYLELAHPYPEDWGEFMRDNGLTYEGVWRGMWTNLERQYLEFAGHHPRIKQYQCAADVPEDELLSAILNNDF